MPLHDSGFDGISPVDALSGEQIFAKISNTINEAYYPFRHVATLDKLHSYDVFRNSEFLVVECKSRLPLQPDINDLRSKLVTVLNLVPGCQGLMEINRHYTAEEILEYC